MCVSISLQDSSGSIYVDSVRLTTISAPPPLPADKLWNLTTSCQTVGPGIVKPFVNCQVTNVPAGYTVPNTFQIRIGSGSENMLVSDSYCDVSYLPGSETTVFCDGVTPSATGDMTYQVYARSSVTQDWIRTSSSVTTHWAI